jgi:hypothetical protein
MKLDQLFCTIGIIKKEMQFKLFYRSDLKWLMSLILSDACQIGIIYFVSSI